MALETAPFSKPNPQRDDVHAAQATCQLTSKRPDFLNDLPQYEETINFSDGVTFYGKETSSLPTQDRRADVVRAASATSPPSTLSPSGAVVHGVEAT